MGDEAITVELRIQALRLLDAVLTWRLSRSGWDRVDRSLVAMTKAWQVGSAVDFATATDELMLSAASRRVRTTPSELPEQAPEPIRDRVATLRTWLSDAKPEEET
ncbi:CATRA system-associated protein [Nonomuraea sp. NPDC050790]|uniref:CATRA system-associated protein n=1 Tax=Nonomuraea sp. NPDC050790 TaxID=3364371 RepID=UPI0037A4BB7B